VRKVFRLARFWACDGFGLSFDGICYLVRHLFGAGLLSGSADWMNQLVWVAMILFVSWESPHRPGFA
jgi:hypothetical protein